MYDRRVAAILREDDSADEEILWQEMSEGRRHLYPRLLFIITGQSSASHAFDFNGDANDQQKLNVMSVDC